MSAKKRTKTRRRGSTGRFGKVGSKGDDSAIVCNGDGNTKNISAQSGREEDRWKL